MKARLGTEQSIGSPSWTKRLSNDYASARRWLKKFVEWPARLFPFATAPAKVSPFSFTLVVPWLNQNSVRNSDDSITTIPRVSSASQTLPSAPDDEIFLEGPRSRFEEFFTLLKVMRDFLRGFRTLHFVGPCVTVFGSARIKAGDPHYELTRKMGAAIARLGFTVITGGGPGIMEAANRGAKEAGGRSVGCTIELPSEQPTNAYLDRCVRMHYFFARKTLLVKYSYAFVVMPGGAGTLDELFEALTLIQTGKIKNFPIVIMGTDYWKELLHFIETMAQRGMIAANDLSLIYATDSVDEAVAHIQSKGIEPFGLKRMTRPRRHLPWLGERGLSPP